MFLRKTILFIVLFSSIQVFTQKYLINNSTDFENAIINFEQFRDSVTATKKLVYNQPIISSALEKYKSVLEWSRINGNKTDVLKAKGVLLELYNYQKNYPELIALGKDILSYDEIYDSKIVVLYLGIISGAYGATANYEEFLKIVPIYHEFGKKYGFRKDKESSYNCDIGQAHYILKNYEKAIISYKLCADEYKQIKNYFQVSSVTNNVGLSFYKNKELDSAKYYYKVAIDNINDNVVEIRKKTDDGYIQHFKNVIESNLAEVFVDEGDFENALPIFKKELKSTKQQKELNLFPSAYFKIANVYYLKNQIEKSQTYADSVFIALKKFQNTSVNERVLLLKAKNFLLQNDQKNSNIYFDLHRSFIDSISTLKSNQNFMNSVVKYETKIKTNQLEATKENLNLQKKKNNLQQLFLIIFIITAFILISFYFKIRKSNQVISHQKNDLEHSLEEKNTLIKEVHHRVKNNLQMVMSILEIQNSTLSNKELKSILSESQNRIQSIALIHEQLYTNNSLNNIELKEYLQKLINQITIISSSKQSKIDYEINIPKINFSTDTTLIIGLIINELVSNIYKHAFVNLESGFFSITIIEINKDNFQLIVTDNGNGIDENVTVENVKSLGLRIVTILINQLKGNMKITNTNGAKFEINFSTDS